MNASLTALLKLTFAQLLVQGGLVASGHSWEDATFACSLLAAVAPLYSPAVRSLYRQAFGPLQLGSASSQPKRT